MTAYPEQARVGVLAVVWREGKVLLARRRNAPQAGYWGFPGGRLELGEALNAAAERELFEETGVCARAQEAFAATEVIDCDQAGRPRYHYVLVAVRMDWRSGEGHAADDVDAVAWVKPEALPEPRSPDVERLIRLQSL